MDEDAAILAEADEFTSAGDIELTEEAVAIGVHAVNGEAHSGGDFLRGKALHEGEDEFSLPRGEFGEEGPGGFSGAVKGFEQRARAEQEDSDKLTFDFGELGLAHTAVEPGADPDSKLTSGKPGVNCRINTDASPGGTDVFRRVPIGVGNEILAAVDNRVDAWVLRDGLGGGVTERGVEEVGAVVAAEVGEDFVLSLFGELAAEDHLFEVRCAGGWVDVRLCRGDHVAFEGLTESVKGDDNSASGVVNESGESDDTEEFDGIASGQRLGAFGHEDSIWDTYRAFGV